jgi:outer membrane protein OmpA-like peptidoglycan-associated protein
MKKHRKPDFAHSLTDLMASVAVTFLLIAAIFIVKSAQANKEKLKPLEEVKTTQVTSRDALEKLFSALTADPAIAGVAHIVHDAADPFLLTITYRSDSLTFGTDRAELAEDARSVIDGSFPILIRQVCAEQQSIESVVLEGHTDAQGGAEKFQYNVELSSRRAHSIFAEARKSVQMMPDQLHCIDSMFTVAGRGPVQPATPVRWDDWDARHGSHPEDRRVEIKVRFSAGEKLLRALADGAKP